MKGGMRGANKGNLANSVGRIFSCLRWQMYHKGTVSSSFEILNPTPEERMADRFCNNSVFPAVCLCLHGRHGTNVRNNFHSKYLAVRRGVQNRRTL